MYRYLAAVMRMESDRLLLWFPVGLGLGIAAYFSLFFEPSWFLTRMLFLSGSVVLILFGGIISLPFFRRFFSARGPFIHIFLHSGFALSIIFTVISLGFLLAKWRTDSVHTQMLSQALRQVHFSAEIVDVEEKNTAYRLLLRKVSVNDLENTQNMPPHFLPQNFPTCVRLNISKKDPIPPIGSRIQGVADFLPFSDPVTLRSYDFRRQAYFQGIGATGRITQINYIEDRDTTGATAYFAAIALWMKDLRHTLTAILKNKIPGVEGAIAAALVTGERAMIPDDVRQAFTDAGLAHLLAISGLHLGLVAAIVFAIFRRGFALFPYIAQAHAIKKYAAVVVLPVMVFYLLISGAGVPAQRSFLMITVVMFGILYDRHAISMRLLALAATIILIIKPESLLSASFQLSFAAVVALIAAYETGWKPLYQWSMEGGIWRRPIIYGVGIIATTIIATMATTPLTIYLFNRFTLQAVIANLIAIPLTATMIMPLLLLSLFSLFMGGFSVFFNGVWLALNFLIQTAHYVAKLPGAVILLPTPSPFFLMATTLGGLWICLWQTRWRWLGIPCVGLGVLTLFFPPDRPDILIAGNGQVMAYHDGKILYTSHPAAGKFYTGFWQRELGLSATAPWPNECMVFQGNKDENRQKSPRILLISETRNRYSRLKFLCQQPYDGIFSIGYLPYFCHQNTMQKPSLDRRDLSSTLLIYVDAKGIRIESVHSSLGKRPWI